MKRFGVFCLVLTLSLAVSAQTFIVGSTEERRIFEPLIASVLRDAGLEPSFIYEPQARLMASLTQGKIQGGFFLTEEMAKSVEGATIVPAPLYANEVVAVTVKQGLSIKSAKDLETLKVGIVRGNPTHKLAVQGATATEYDSMPTLFKLLAGGRLDAVLSSKTGVPGHVKAAGITTYTVHEPVLLSIELYFVVSSSGKESLGALTEAFKRKIDSGQWAKEYGKISKKTY